MRNPRLEPQVDILVVDDTPMNLQILARMLKSQGFGVRPVPTGAMALRAARMQVPDMILLDINMPEMNGFEVCEKLKADPVLCEVPVIFISALSALTDKTRAFAAGGVDYITKPFQLEEVRVRVSTHLRISRLQHQLEERNAALEDSLRKQRDLELLRDNLIHMLVHDMRSPLTGICASLQFLEADLSEHIPQENREDIARAIAAGRRLTNMVSDLLDINRMENDGLELNLANHRLTAIVGEARSALGGLAKDHEVSQRFDSSFRVRCDADLITRVLINLFANAIKFTPPGPDSIQVFATTDSPFARIEIRDAGPGIPAEYQQIIFDKFGQVRLRKERAVPSSGLGLPFCKLAIAAHGGQIGVDSEPGRGSTFWFTVSEATDDVGDA